MVTAQDQQQAFVERLFGDVLGAMTIAAVAIGERLGLYALLSDGVPRTSAEVAAATGLAERYVREWMEQQAADGILDLARDSDDPAQRAFGLPAAHAAALADRDNLDYLAPLANVVMAGTARLPEVIEAFRTGGGVPWDDYGEEMRRAQGDANRPLFLHQLAQEYLPAIPDAHAILSRPGARVAEIGSGMGWASIGIARAYPGVTVDGFDPDAPAVEHANRAAEEAGLADRVRFLARDAATADGVYDLVAAFECIHDLPRPVEVLAGMKRMLAPDGVCIVMDERVADRLVTPADEVERLMYGYSLLVCLPDGMSHPPSSGTGTVMRPAILRAYAQQAGFEDIDLLDDLEHPFFRFYRLR
jgi:SAM-dependent methyltransferase